MDERSTSRRGVRVWLPLLLAAALPAASCTSACWRRTPEVPDDVYRQAVVSFYTGLAALQTSQEVLARSELDQVTTLVPHEPAAWANVGLLLLRQQEIDAATERLNKAAELAPDDARIQRLVALAAGRRGDLPTAVRHWKRALELDPDDPKAAYALARDLERAGGDENEAEAQRTLDRLAARTGNLVVQLDLARIAAKRQDAGALQRALSTLDSLARGWPADVRGRLDAVREAAKGDTRAAGRQIAFLRNLLLRLPDYRRSLAAISTPRDEVGEPITTFLVLPNPEPHAAAADTGMTFTVTGAPAIAGTQRWAGAIPLTGEGAPSVAASDGSTVRLAGQGGTTPAAVAVDPTIAGDDDDDWRHSVLAADLTYDYRTDLVLTGPRGIRILRQNDAGGFDDATASTELPADRLSMPVWDAWAADADTDGDLDLVVAPVDGAPVVLRNNTDGTFAVQEPFAGVQKVRGFVWADVDGEGVPDAAFLQDDGRVRVLLNARSGSFREREVPESFPRAVAIAAAEVSGDAILDLVVLTADGALVSLSQAESGDGWAQAEVGRTAGGSFSIGAARLLTGDLDNNAAIDFVASSGGESHVLLGAADGAFQALGSPLALAARAVADTDADGRLELVGLTAEGRLATAASRGTKPYHWQILRPRSATSTGDQRINSFGIGGEVEVRTGLHVQRRLITSPVVHVGLGEATGSEVTRLLWPNGTIQSEFDLRADTAVAATQRLKGSCPWLFAWNGREMGFVTDVLWRSPLGLRINAQETADVLMTEDRVKMRGDQLAPRDGAYDVRITAELWETHFFDHVALMVVDHPKGTEVWIDERFAVPPPAVDPIVTGPVQAFGAVRDDGGRDVSAVVAARDDRHLDFAGRGAYQGITRDHYVEVEVPDSAPRSGPLWLVAQGWIHPTDSSVNVAISQGDHPRPRSLELQVADRAGRFRTAAPDLGFPAGKDKTILVDLGRHLPRTGPRRFRLATNLEIFWDRLGWAVGRPDVSLSPVRLLPGSAELRYRGYSVTEQKDASTPERPRYLLEGTAPRWRDLEGYHTRFGDVRELLLRVDDRYVIMNAGDELRLRFPEAPPAAGGHVRDFVMISDGWEKDGDYNTTFSRTVLPLPTHEHGRYDRPPAGLEDDPVYLKHPADFAEYHTRYVTPDRVRDALRPAQERP